jgi:penicillin amidase
LIDQTFGDELGEKLLGKARPTLNQALPLILPIPSSPWFDDVRTTDLETRDLIIARALEEAVDDLSEQLGSNMAKWRWGELHQATFRNQSLGESGISLLESVFNRGPFEVDGTLSTVNNTAYDPAEPFAVETVPSYRQIIDLSDFSQSLSIHTTGQSGHPYHPHYDDMIDMWRNFEYHPMLWERSTVEGTAPLHLILQP